MHNYKKISILLILSTLILSACAFPNKEKTENQVPAKDQLSMVQTAVDEYKRRVVGYYLSKIEMIVIHYT